MMLSTSSVPLSETESEFVFAFVLLALLKLGIPGADVIEANSSAACPIKLLF